LDGIQKCFMFEFDEFSIISKCVDLEDIDWKWLGTNWY
jgi:hypothetical protein